ncbi:MAG: chorismate mutase [Lactobacillus sp.]|jgi:chorismate mutase/prephenate dehydratase|nr:chorismate mutase [Lactobacillus sp.]MCI2032223.1 chorismate mutase [Lactobacillus sp.]
MEKMTRRWRQKLAGTPQEQALTIVREEVTAIDHQLVTLLEQRFSAVATIGALKVDRSQPVRDLDRETAVLRDVAAQLEKPALAPYCQAIFETIMQESRRLQENSREEGVN